MQDVLSPFPDWKADVLADHSQQIWLEKHLFSLRIAYPIDQPEEQKSVTFDAPSHGTGGTEGERLSKDYHREGVVFLPLLSR
jgi:hypothetical protein